MKNFDEFVKHIVAKWRIEKKTVYESFGLGMPANRTIGDAAEQYIARKISNHKPSYATFFPNGSQTPSDLYSVARRNGYWHLMLTQVKCSTNKAAIYELNKTEIKQFAAFARFVKKEFLSNPSLKIYRDKPIIFSIGYAGVFSNQSASIVRHQLVSAKSYSMFRANCGALDLKSVAEVLFTTHNLEQ